MCLDSVKGGGRHPHAGLALLIFGGIKGHFTGIDRVKSAVQALLVGGLAAAGAYLLAYAFG